MLAVLRQAQKPLFSFHSTAYNRFHPIARTMIIAAGVEADTIGREWRCKWSQDNGKASLVAAQKALNEVLAELKGVDGVKRVDRIVCGGCMDFKVITTLPEDKFGIWKDSDFAPETSFLKTLKEVNGITQVETQTYTMMTM